MIGQKLGQYEVVAQIGAGGMGEVYRARDSKLNREVALKLVPDSLAHEPERLTRLQREARVLASLNHPHIATLFDLGEDQGRHFLVMELVEGADLSERLKGGPLPVNEAIQYAIQICEALEVAHEQNVVHRDLKPANIKVDAQGQVKVLDFGLAKAIVGDPDEMSMSQSPTVTAGATAQGVLLGTAPYMSPEQARGKVVDKRTDIWAFGCVLFEMLTGDGTFTGDTISDSIANTLQREPEWSKLPANTPDRVRRVLERALTKDIDRRMRDIADARVDLEDALAGKPLPQTAAPKSRSGLGWLAVGAVAGVAIGALIMSGRGGGTTEPQSPIYLSIDVPVDIEMPGAAGLTISPDGQTVAFGAYVGNDARIFLRDLDSPELRPLFETGSGADPFFSPDGKWIAYQRDVGSDQEIVRVPVGGGPARVVGKGGSVGRSVWSGNEEIIGCTSLISGLYRFPVDGGEPRALTEPDTAAGEFAHWFPRMLPDGEHVMFTVWRTRIDDAEIRVVSLETGEQRTLVKGGVFGSYVPSGHLLYTFRTTMMAVPFDLGRLETIGDAVPVLDPVGVVMGDGRTQAVVANNGTLAWIKPNTFDAELVWLGFDGTVEPAFPVKLDFDAIDLGPKGRTLVADVDFESDSDLWLIDLELQSRTPLTFDGMSSNPRLSPDGKRIAFQSMSRGPYEVFELATDGTGSPRVLIELEGKESTPCDWFPDGSRLLFTRWPSDTSTDVMALSFADGAITPVYQSRFTDTWASISPDGEWVAVSSVINEQSEAFIASVDPEGPRARVSANGGQAPRFTPDGSAILFWGEIRGALYRSEITYSPELRVGDPVVVIPEHQHGGAIEDWDIHPDGDRILVILNPERGGQRIDLVLNWFTEIERLVPTGR